MRKKIRYVILLMGLALAGILSFQLFWIYNTYQINRDQLGKDIARVLDQAVDKIMGRELITLVVDAEENVRNVILRPQLINKESSLDSVKVRSITMKDMEGKKGIDALVNSIGHDLIQSVEVDATKSGKSTNIKLQLNDKSDSSLKAQSMFRFFTDSLSPSPREGSIVATATTSAFVGDSISTTTVKPSIQVEQMIGASTFFVGGDGQVFEFSSEPFQPEEIEGILKGAMTEIGIDQPFAFGLLDQATDTFRYQNQSDIAPKTLKAGYSLPIAGIGRTKPETLYLYLPNATQIILGKIWAALLASTLLVGATVFCFGYTLRLIFRQKQLSEIKNDFINNMTHEFKTPISTISLAIEALLNFDVQKDPKRTTQYLEIGRNETNRLGMMVEKVLKIAASEKNNIQLKMEQVDVHQLIEKIKGNIEVQLQEKQGKLLQELKANSPIIEADQVHLTNVIYNLLDNATKYSKGQPEIKIVTEDVRGKLRISVQDNGIGISNSQQKRIFDKFYRVPNGNIHNVKGFGLGLSYVADIVHKHTGAIEVKSEPNQGSIFDIYLPLNQPA